MQCIVDDGGKKKDERDGTRSGSYGTPGQLTVVEPARVLRRADGPESRASYPQHRRRGRVGKSQHAAVAWLQVGIAAFGR